MGSYMDVESIIAMLPKPGGIAPTAAPPATPAPTQPPFVPTQQPVNIQLTVAKDDQGRERYDRDGRPVYVSAPSYGPGYGPGYPGGMPYVPGVGGIGSYPGIAGDASVRIGSINSSVTQGNMNWAGEQALGGVFPNPTTAPPGTAPPMMEVMPQPMMPMVTMETMPPAPGGFNWTWVIFGLCLVLALGVAGWLLYTKYYKGKGGKNNANAGRANGNNTNARRATAAAGADANEFGDFGDFDAAPGGNRA